MSATRRAPGGLRAANLSGDTGGRPTHGEDSHPAPADPRSGDIRKTPATSDAEWLSPGTPHWQADHALSVREGRVTPPARPNSTRPRSSSAQSLRAWRHLDAGSEPAGAARGLSGVTFSTADLVGLRSRATGLSLDACRSSRGARSGTRTSRIRGRGMEYSESRIYFPGDDIRSIDWRVTARTGRVHTKLFHEERDRPVHFVVDLGDHMRFGTRQAFKSVVAAEAVSLLAWTAADHGDRVGGLVFAGPRATESRLQSGRRGALALFRTLAGFEAEAREPADGGIEDAVSRLHKIARPGSLVVMISDFSGMRDSLNRQLAKLREFSDLLCVWVYDRLEAVLPPPARYPIGDGRRTAALDTRSSEVVRAVLHRFDAFEARIASACARSGAILVPVRCGDDVRAVLRGSLNGRARRPERRFR